MTVFGINRIWQTHAIALCLFLGLSGSHSFSDTSSDLLERCNLTFAQLQAPKQREYNFRVSNFLREGVLGNLDNFFADNWRGPKRKDPSQFKKSTSLRDTLETLVLELEASRDLFHEDRILLLSELTGLPQVYTSLLFAYYRLREWSRPELEALTEHLATTPPNELSPKSKKIQVQDTWSKSLRDASPLFSLFLDWITGSKSELKEIAAPDPLWNIPLESSLRILENLWNSKKESNIQEFLDSHEPYISHVIGNHIESEQLGIDATKHSSHTIIPGSEITVSGKKHVDGLEVEFGRDGTLVLHGFLESKSSISGVEERALTQHQGFLYRLLSNPTSVFIFGKPILSTKISLKTTHGIISLPDFIKLHGTKYLDPNLAPNTFHEFFEKDFSNNFYKVYSPKEDRALEQTFSGTHLQGQKTKQELRSEIAKLIAKRLQISDPEKLLEIETWLKQRIGYGNGTNGPNAHDTIPTKIATRAEALEPTLPPLEPKATYTLEEYENLFITRAELTSDAAFETHSNVGSITSDTPAFFNSLARHLGVKIQERLNFAAPIKNKHAGTTARTAISTQNKSARRQIGRRLKLLIETHNEWAKENKKVDLLISEDPSTPEEIATAIDTLVTAQDPSFPFQKLFETTASLTSKDAFENFSQVGNFVNDTPGFFDSLARHLGTTVQDRLTKTAPITNKFAGGTARNPNPQRNKFSRRQIAKRLKLLIEAHNQWAKANNKHNLLITKDPSTPQEIIDTIDTLFSAQDPTFPYQRLFEKNSTLVSGDSFEKFSENFTKDTPEFFNNLARHLPVKIQQQLEDNSPITNKRAGANARDSRASTNKSPRRQIAKRLTLLIQAQNQWVKDNSRPELLIPQEPSNSQEIATAIETLVTAQDPSFPYQRLFETDDTLTSENAFTKRFPMGSFTVDTPEFFLHLARHLEIETQEALNAAAPITNKQSGAAARNPDQNVNRLARRQIAKRLKLLIDAHNNWAQKKELHDLLIPEEPSTAQEIAIAVSTLSTSQDPTFPYQKLFENNADLTSKNAFEKFSPAGSFTGNISEFFDNLARHLETETQAKLKIVAPIKNKLAGNLARSLQSHSHKSARRQIAKRLKLLIEAHNQWAKDNEKPELLIPEEPSTAEAVRKAVRILSIASGFIEP